MQARLEEDLQRLAPGRSLRWMSDDELRARSSGQVKKACGMNARTEKPERAGVFCARIFGPVEDLSCICTKYRGEVHRGVECDKCGVIVTETAVRGVRFGHLELPVPVRHPWDDTHRPRVLLVLPAGMRNDGEMGDSLRKTNGLYQRLVERVSQLERCVRFQAPSAILEHETALLEDAVGRLVGKMRRRAGPGPTLSDHLQRELAIAEEGDELPYVLEAVLAAIGFRLSAP